MMYCRDRAVYNAYRKVTMRQSSLTSPAPNKEVLGQGLPWLDGLERARRPVRMPTVLTPAEVQRLLGCMQGTKWLMASLLYGAGLRLRECLKLRERGVTSPLDRLRTA